MQNRFKEHLAETLVYQKVIPFPKKEQPLVSFLSLTPES